MQEINEVKEVEEVKETAARVGLVKKYRDLLVYKQAYCLALEVSKLTKRVPARRAVRTWTPIAAQRGGRFRQTRLKDGQSGTQPQNANVIYPLRRARWRNAGSGSSDQPTKASAKK